MKATRLNNTQQPSSKPEARAEQGHGRLRAVAGFALFAFVLCLLFARPLVALVRFAGQDDLYSHILLIPFISAYLFWIQRERPPFEPARFSRWAALPFLAGLAVQGVYWTWFKEIGLDAPNDYLFFQTLSFVLFLIAGVLGCFGLRLVRARAFPIAFLFFLVPFPWCVEQTLEWMSQHASAQASAWLFMLTGTSVARDGMMFHLPGITIQVAQECSGIRSSFVLFIVSLVAGHLFLTHRRHQVWLALLVIPLGILRNGIRIVTIALLCVHIDTSMISAPIHRRGGPFFFALSLIPFFALLLWLRKVETKSAKNAAPPPDPNPAPS